MTGGSTVRGVWARRVRTLIRAFGYDIVKSVPPAVSSGPHQFPPDFAPSDIDTYMLVTPFTMAPAETIYSVCEGVRYVVRHRIPGEIVECGVWKGGSMMAVARTLLQLNERSYNLYLFDTFEGMTPPTEHDVDFRGVQASELMATSDKQALIWACSPIEETRKAVHSVGYPLDKIHFVKGRVEDTIPAHAPAAISFLRLDTDWYESTLHELVHLFPRLSVGGVIIIDDYGHWRGSRKATDEYLQDNNVRLLLNRINYTGRIGIKT